MTTQTDTLRKALEALEYHQAQTRPIHKTEEAIVMLRTVLSQQAQEPQSVKYDLQMDAYYYEFQPTGVLMVDRILSAVAEAGKAYHHTWDWRTETSAGEGSPQDWIQQAANDAAKLWMAKIAEFNEAGLEVAKQRDEWREKATFWENLHNAVAADADKMNVQLRSARFEQAPARGVPNVCQARLEHGEWADIPLDSKAVALANGYEVRTKETYK